MWHRNGWASVLILLLTACSSEPSESEILESMQAALSLSNQDLLGGYQNAPELPNITSLEKIQCRYVSAAKRYECDINLTLKSAAGELKERGRVNLVEEGDSWVVVE